MDQAQVWLPKGFSENGLAFSEDGGKNWTRCEGAKVAIAVGIGKAKDGADYETLFIWGAAKEGDPIGIYRSTDKCKTFERVNDDAHQYGGPGNGNFVQGDMNTFGVVYMSTVGRGLVVGAPEGTEFVTKTVRSRKVVNTGALQILGRNLAVSISGAGKVVLFGADGKAVFSMPVTNGSSVGLEKVPAGRYVARLFDTAGNVLAIKPLLLR